MLERIILRLIYLSQYSIES